MAGPFPVGTRASGGVGTDFAPKQVSMAELRKALRASRLQRETMREYGRDLPPQIPGTNYRVPQFLMPGLSTLNSKPRPVDKASVTAQVDSWVKSLDDATVLAEITKTPDSELSSVLSPETLQALREMEAQAKAEKKAADERQQAIARTASSLGTSPTASPTPLAEGRGPTEGRPAPGVMAGPLGGVMQWADKAKVYADKYKVPLDVVLGIMDIESGGRQTATSSADAQGLMQVMPDNLRALGVPEDKFQDPDANIEAGVKMLADGYRQYGDWDKAAMNYYGPAAVANPDKKYYGVSGNDYKAQFQSARANVAARIQGGGAPGQETGPRAPKTEAQLWAMSKDELSQELAYAYRQPQVKSVWNEGLSANEEQPSEWAGYVNAVKVALESRFPGADQVTPQQAARAANTAKYGGGQAPPGPLASPPGGPSFGYAGETRLPQSAGGTDVTGKSLEQLYAQFYSLQGPFSYTDTAGDQQLTPSGVLRENLATEIKRQEDKAKEAKTASAEELANKRYGLDVEKFGYDKSQNEITRQDALQKERNAILKAKVEAEQYLAQLEAEGQKGYAEAASWGLFKKGQPIPTAPSFPGMPGLDLSQYLTPAPDFYGPARTARERIMQQLAAMKVGG